MHNETKISEIMKTGIAITIRISPIILIVHILFLLFVLSLEHPTEAFAHGGKVITSGGEMNQAGQESLIKSKYIKGPMVMKADPELDQWKQSSETNIKSIGQHDISVRTLNNGTHIFFLLSWYDPTVNDTNDVNDSVSTIPIPTNSNIGLTSQENIRNNIVTKASDGAAIIFEFPNSQKNISRVADVAEQNQTSSAKSLGNNPLDGVNVDQKQDNKVIAGEENELRDIWYWKQDTEGGEILKGDKNVVQSVTHMVVTKSEWKSNQWNILFGRQIISPVSKGESTNKNFVPFHAGVREESFIKFIVWDGAKGESFSTINDEDLNHFDFILLPEINIYPKDVYIWSAILVGSTGFFLFVDQRLYKRKNGIL